MSIAGISVGRYLPFLSFADMALKNILLHIALASENLVSVYLVKKSEFKLYHGVDGII